jgi:hypothetical protein
MGIARASTVFNYARRGRGKSGDTRPYAVQREIEDIEALVAEAGGSGRTHDRHRPFLRAARSSSATRQAALGLPRLRDGRG